MLNAYVHLEVLDLSADVLDGDAFIDALYLALPDAGISGDVGHPLGLTLSQFAVTNRAAAHRQVARARAALAAIGWPDATLRVAEVVRESVRDDIGVLIDALRWKLARRART
jgi:hypothetical protein